jgi:glycosyltransferase involved in cell wall biosynthesis
VPAAILILPQGLTVTGVTTWALWLAAGLQQLGTPCALLVHGSIAGHGEIDAAVPPGVRVFRRDDLPPVHTLRGDVTPLADAYAAAASQLAAEHPTAGPVCLVPTRAGDCFAAAALVCERHPALARLVGWQHADSPYERALIRWAAPACHALACVSEQTERHLRAHFRHLAPIHRVTNGVPIRPAPRREPLAGRALRLVFTGRLDHQHKRVGALVAMGDALANAATPFELTLVGDGPAAGDIASAARTRPWLRAAGAVPPERIGEHLDRADIFVLSSRYEGLSVSMLEAMASGCCPVVTDTASGAREAVLDGVTGILVPFTGDDTDETVGAAMASGVRRALSLGPRTLGAAARARASERFSLESHARQAAAVFAAAAAAGPRIRDGDRPIAFSAPDHAESSGTVPRAAAERLARVLADAAGSRVALHGVGEHTLRLRRVIEPASHVVAFSDDDPARWHTALWGRPVLPPPGPAPSAAAAAALADLLGTGGVVVLSSWIHQPALWNGRDRFERAGLSVRRLYADDECP